jgi:hypothetical protein
MITGIPAEVAAVAFAPLLIKVVSVVCPPCAAFGFPRPRFRFRLWFAHFDF